MNMLESNGVGECIDGIKGACDTIIESMKIVVIATLESMFLMVAMLKSLVLVNELMESMVLVIAMLVQCSWWLQW